MTTRGSSKLVSSCGQTFGPSGTGCVIMLELFRRHVQQRLPVALLGVGLGSRGSLRSYVRNCRSHTLAQADARMADVLGGFKQPSVF
jgi:hypothetical protein